MRIVFSSLRSLELNVRFWSKILAIFCAAYPLLSGNANAQSCPELDKYRLARVMAIDPPLIPILNLEIPSCANINVAEDYAGFVLNDENIRLNNGVRSEIAIDFPFQEGDVIEYRWSVMLPSVGAPGGEGGPWWLIAQWHDQPDPRLGETWANFKAEPPPVAVFVERRNGVLGIGLNSLGGQKGQWSPVPTNVWMNIRVMIHWSRGGDGYVRLTVDDRPGIVLSAMGVNMLNRYRHYFKAGQYRAPWVRQYAVVYMKNIRFRKL